MLPPALERETGFEASGGGGDFSRTGDVPSSPTSAQAQRTAPCWCHSGQPLEQRLCRSLKGARAPSDRQSTPPAHPRRARMNSGPITRTAADATHIPRSGQDLKVRRNPGLLRYRLSLGPSRTDSDTRGYLAREFRGHCGVSSIGKWPRWPLTRSNHSRSGTYGFRSKPPASAQCVYA